MAQRLRWGILGTGNIARQFSAGVNASHRCQLAAVASRQQASADAFARDYQIANAYGDYGALLRDPSVDAIYVSLPNSLHHEWTIRALEAGKHVLCEKPFAMSVEESRQMFDAAQRAGRLVMEAFMYRSHPLTHAVADAIKGGEIGQVKIVRTSFCYRTRKIEGNVRFDPALGGGVLMDVGCYCINFSRFIAGEEPSVLLAAGNRHETGVDDLVCGTLQFPSGILASFTCGMSTQADNTAYVLGTEGYIEIPVPWKPPVKGAQFTIARGIPPKMDSAAASPTAPPAPPPRQTISVDAPTELYGMEADDFAAAVIDGKPLPVTPEDTLGNMLAIEKLLLQIQSRW